MEERHRQRYREVGGGEASVMRERGWRLWEAWGVVFRGGRCWQGIGSGLGGNFRIKS